jgi:hypothetical protein
MVPSSDVLNQASPSLRLKMHPNRALDTIEILEASSAKRRGSLLVFVAPASALSSNTLLALGRAAHQHLPMVEARLRAMNSEPHRQYIRLARSEDRGWSCVVANLRLRKDGRITPVVQSAVRLPASTDQVILPLAVEVVCRRARLALLELDPTTSEELETRFIDELIACEAEMLRCQLAVKTPLVF